MGEVYRAEDLILGQPVALKFLPETAAKNEAIIARFRNEVRIARQVSHPNVCRVYDVGETDGLIFLSMEYVDGEDLSSLLRRIGRLPQDKALEIARQVAAGLAAAHQKGVLHRDLKPANVMLDGQGHALISDFGLAALAEQIPGADVRSGTPAYMSPEQLAGREVTVRSDLYSLGLVLYEIFTGKHAFKGDTLPEIMRTREGPPSSPSTWVKDLDPAVERVIMRCLEPDPVNRPPSALSVAAAMPGGDPLAAALAAGETPSPAMVAAAGRTVAMAPGRAIGALLAILAGLVLVAVLGIRLDGLKKLNLQNPPEVMTQKARDIIHDLGYQESPADSSGGFSYDQDFINYVEKNDKPQPVWNAILSTRQPLLTYWYRQSPRALVPDGFGGAALTPGIVDADDPPPILSGMVNVLLDTRGRLISFQAIPAEMEEHPQRSRVVDWNLLFAAADLHLAEFQAAEPTWASLAAADQRAAWTGKWPGTDRPLRIEAAAWQGKPVFFSLIGPWTRPKRMKAFESTVGQKVGNIIGILTILLVLSGAILLAHRNYVQGRGDRNGAWRLAGAIFLMSLSIWLFSAHIGLRGQTLGLFVLATSTALFLSCATWLLYMALEPYVRRHWPQTIISWSRVIAGRLRDPLVGRDILSGMALGLAWVLIFQVGYLALERTGALPMFGSTRLLEGTRQTLGLALGNVLNSVVSTLVFFFVLFLLRVTLRNRWVAAAGFIAIWAAPRLLRSEHLLIEAPMWLLIYGIAAIAVVRFGLVALATAIFLTNALLNVPVTLDFAQWYAGNSLFVFLIFLALASWSFYIALAGQRLWKEELFE
jgi:serine/threonine-protein kinase